MPAQTTRSTLGRPLAHPIHSALQRFKQEGRGVIVFLRDGAAGVPNPPNMTTETDCMAGVVRLELGNLGSH